MDILNKIDFYFKMKPQDAKWSRNMGTVAE
jgi:hypothetical protein